MLATPASLLFRLRMPEETGAWDRFVDLYSPLLYHWARQLGEQDSDCADLVQDVFLILWRKLPEFEYDSGRSFHAWLKTVFANRFHSRKKKRQLQAADPHTDPLDVEWFRQRTDEDNRYLIQQAFRFIESEFSPTHQQVFRRYVLEEHSAEAVASEFGVTVGTVYGIKSRILNRLRQELHQVVD